MDMKIFFEDHIFNDSILSDATKNRKQVGFFTHPKGCVMDLMNNSYITICAQFYGKKCLIISDNSMLSGADRQKLVKSHCTIVEHLQPESVVRKLRSRGISMLQGSRRYFG